MQKLKKSSLVIHENDLQVLQELLKTGDYQYAYDRKNAEDLKQELLSATVLANEKFPSNVIRLNSRVCVREDRTGKLLEFILVTPGKADIRNHKISVLAPIGTALLGFKQGDRVKWKMPAGNKYFTILEVVNGLSTSHPR